MLKVARYKWKYPLSHERHYQKQLTALVNKMHDVVFANMNTINAYIKQYRTDDESADQLERIKQILIEQYGTEVTKEFIERKVNEMFDTINGYNANEMTQTLKSAFGVDMFAANPDLDTLKTLWANENIAYTKSIETQYFDRTANIISNAVRNGDLTKDVSSQIEAQTGVSQRRAQVIARDQIGTLNGQLTQVRQTDVGIRQYIWRTSEDRRVRPEHRARDGKTFDWDNPPPDGHPGVPVSCRCVALPIIDIDKINVMRVHTP